ncbi:hypothetical protein SCHPADRAFT_931664 [Schizopora paradoxa]|uniref:WD40 repeat-like protein n=1 Tax=Schizopora paradoxa TaxID=27342 RepID=A0A0H2RGI5_9AGAM|nr:hypothetical protein SCHPADRAFT_931664 [Schizopora paradoxa]
MKRKDLPGFYWDDARQRYFPVGSQNPLAKSQVQKGALEAARDNIVKTQTRKDTTKDKLSSSLASTHVRILRKNNLRYSQVLDIRHQLRAAEIANFCMEGRQSYGATRGSKFLSFKAVNTNDKQYLVAGDNRGRFALARRFLDNPSSHFEAYIQYFPVGEQIRHVLNKGSRFIGIGTGNSSGIFVSDQISNNSSSSFILKLNQFPEIFSASLHDDTVALGARRSIKIINSISLEQENWTTLNCDSDIMSLYQHDNSILAGSRNGTIQLFDVRSSNTRGTRLLDDRYRSKGQRLISHISVIRDWEMLVSTSAGDLEMFDLRYSASSKPIIRYGGHVNSVRSDLGIDVDPSNEFIFAAGEDNALRGWSLKSGRPLRNQSSGLTDLLKDFNIEDEITCLQITEELDGLRLWITNRDMIRSFNLGIADNSVSLYNYGDRTRA